MSIVLENAYNEVEKSKFNFKDNRTLEIQNAFIFYRNFAGKPDRYGNATRKFNVAINEEVAKELAAKGYTIHHKPSIPEKDSYGNIVGGSNYVDYIEVKVNMDAEIPPTIAIFVEYNGIKRKKALDPVTVGELDRIDILSADCIINLYTSPNYNNKCTGYVKKLYAIQDSQEEFDGKYNDYNYEGYEQA